MKQVRDPVEESSVVEVGSSPRSDPDPSRNETLVRGVQKSAKETRHRRLGRRPFLSRTYCPPPTSYGTPSVPSPDLGVDTT